MTTPRKKPMQEEFKEEINPIPQYGDVGITCMCGRQSMRSDLAKDKDIEFHNPANWNNPNCNMQDTSGCHWSFFEKCTGCGRILFSDGKPTGLGKLI